MEAHFRAGALALCALTAPATPARALPAPVPHQVVAIESGYVLPEITVFQGDTLTLTNLDPRQAHDLVSLNFGPEGVRVFGSAPAAPGERVEVAGVASLRPSVYPFYCSLHASMIGNLRVDPPPGLPSAMPVAQAGRAS